MYFLLSGRATVVNDKGVRVKSFVEGSFFGEVGCMLGGVRSADVVAASTCQLQVGSRDQFHASNDFHDFTITKFYLNHAINKQMVIRSLFNYVKVSMKLHPNLTNS